MPNNENNLPEISNNVFPMPHDKKAEERNSVKRTERTAGIRLQTSDNKKELFGRLKKSLRKKSISIL